MSNLSYLTKGYKSLILDLDKAKGIVVMYVNAFNKLDTDNDITVKGSFAKTIKENQDRIKHFYNHDKTKLLGCPVEMVEDDIGLKVTSAINLNKQLGKDVFSDYVHFAEHNKSLEHSYGLKVIKRDEKDRRKITEQKMFEYSTLSHFAANEYTPLLEIKEMESRLRGEGSDEHLKQIETKLYKIKQMLKEKKDIELVTCPGCGLTFDYNGVEEFTIEKMVKNTLNMLIRWATEEEIQKYVTSLRPEIQSMVAEIVANFSLTEAETEVKEMTTEQINSIKEKSLSYLKANITTYVKCPKCYEHTTKSLNGVKPEATTLPTEEPNKKEWYQLIDWKLK